jgi:hypothetical protein
MALTAKVSGAGDAEVEACAPVAIDQHHGIGIAQFVEEGAGGDGVVLPRHAHHGHAPRLERHEIGMLGPARRTSWRRH